MNKYFETNINDTTTNEITFTHCINLIEDLNNKNIEQGEILKFAGITEEYDVYNPSAPFIVNGIEFITARVEKTKDIANSQVMLFKKINGVWSPANEAPTFEMEDGFAAYINKELIIGGVETFKDPIPEYHINYKTVFYRGKDPTSLERFATGPDKMKDIRIIYLTNNKIGVFTRPQGKIGGKGKIGYIEIEKLEDLNDKSTYDNAKIINNQFPEGEWGGVNELHLLPNGKIGVIGHIAYEDNTGKHYYAMAFVYNPIDDTASPIKIIATRKNFPDGKSKTNKHADIIFPGGLIRNNDGTATLYAGLGDAEAGKITIEDPFKDEK